MDKTFRTILFLFFAVAAIQIGVVVVSLRNIQRASKSSQWVNHTHAFLAELNQTLASARAAEGALHTYLLTNDPGRQDAFRDEFAQLAEHIEVAKALAASDETNATEVGELEDILFARADLARELLAAHRAGESDEVQAQLSADAAAENMVDLVRLVNRIRARNTELLNRQDQEAYQFDQSVRLMLYIGAGTNLLILLGAAWFIRDDLTARRRAAQVLQESNDLLEKRVAERTAELVEANGKLKTENLEGRWRNQALNHQLRYNHLIIDSISDLVLVITKASNISRVNPAVTRATGFTQTELVDQPISDIIAFPTPEDGPPLVDPLVDALRSGKDLPEQDIQLKDKRGKLNPARFSLYPLRDNDKVVGAVVTVRVTRSA